MEIMLDRYDERSLREMGADTTSPALLAAYRKVRTAWDKGFKGQLDRPLLVMLACEHQVQPKKEPSPAKTSKQLAGAAN